MSRRSSGISFTSVELSDRLAQYETAPAFTEREKTVLQVGTGLTREDFTRPDSELTIDFLRRRGARREHIIHLGMEPRVLRARGATLESLSSMQFSSADLVLYPPFCHALIDAYGRDAVHQTFARTASDAVMLAATPAAKALGLSTVDLLRFCGRNADAALGVVSQTGVGGLPASALLECGLTLARLREVGVSVVDVANGVTGQPDEVVRLGLRL